MEMNLMHMPSIVTLGIFLLTWLGTFIWSASKWYSSIRILEKKIDDLEQHINTMTTRFDNEILRLENWGKKVVAEREKYNEETYLRRDLYDEKHINLIKQIQTIIGYDLPVRLTKIEVTQKAIEATQQQILIKFEQLVKR